MTTSSLEALRDELLRQEQEFARACEVLATAGEDTFVAAERVDELRAALASTTPAPAAQGFFIRM